ncbi:MAG: phage major capsid protein, partial [Gammaproteobacteria bacterium]|nr:phage major capsid protein [Gammaproteobacteria bacterium]
MKMSDREKLGLWLQSLIYPKKFKNSKKITKQTGQEEGDDTEGGYLVDHALLPVILAPNFAEGKLYADCTIFNLGKDNVNGARIPRSAETSRTNAGLKGGVNAYWKEEGETKLASIAKFDIIDLGLDKLAGVVYLTDEVKQDPVLLVSYMSFALKEAIMYKVDRAIVYGVPGEMAGIALDPATGAVAISAPIAVGELKDIFDLYYGGAKGKWYVSKGIWNEITDLYDDPTIPLTFGDSGPMLWGMPVVVSDVFDERDLMLGDLSQYLIIQKEITSAISIHLKYLEDESVMRFVLRINGQGLWTGPITLQDTSTVHPFVMTTGGEMSSSSSSS